MNRTENVKRDAAPGATGATSTVSNPAAADRTPPWLVVMMREIMVKLTDRNFLIGTGLTLVLLVGSTAFNGYMASRGTSATVAVTSQAGADVVRAAEGAFKAGNDKSSLTATTVSGEDSAKQQVVDGTADAYLYQKDGSWTLAAAKDDSSMRRSISQVVQQRAISANAAAAGTTPERIFAGTQLGEERIVKPGSSSSSDESVARQVIGFIFAFLFYMASLMFGMAIASSVVEEKQSRVVEILATAVPIRHILMGKVAGNTVLALGQMLLFVGVGLIGVSFTPWKEFLPMFAGASGWFLVFFVVGFVALACVWAVAGSLASRNEDLGSTTTPLTMILVLALFSGMSASGTWQTVASYIPIVSAIVMPARIAEGGVSVWEPIVSLAITIAMAALTISIGTKLYRRSVMQTGGRVSLRQAFSAQSE